MKSVAVTKQGTSLFLVDYLVTIVFKVFAISSQKEDLLKTDSYKV
jgi:hypothetical protein